MQRLEQDVLAEHGRQAACEDRQRKRGEKGQPGLRGHEIHGEGRKHDQLTMHEVHDAHDAEQQRDAQCDQHIDQAHHQPTGDGLHQYCSAHGGESDRFAGQGTKPICTGLPPFTWAMAIGRVIVVSMP